MAAELEGEVRASRLRQLPAAVNEGDVIDARMAGKRLVVAAPIRGLVEQERVPFVLRDLVEREFDDPIGLLRQIPVTHGDAAIRAELDADSCSRREDGASLLEEQATVRFIEIEAEMSRRSPKSGEVALEVHVAGGAFETERLEQPARHGRAHEHLSLQGCLPAFGCGIRVDRDSAANAIGGRPDGLVHRRGPDRDREAGMGTVRAWQE